MSNNTKAFGESGAWRGWRELSGDVCWEEYGAKWGRKDPSNDQVFFVIRHENMEEALGEREFSESSLPKHLDTVYRVDLDEVPQDEIDSALTCCGVDWDDYNFSVDDKPWVIVECLVDYGCAAPMGEHGDVYAMRARAAARRAVDEMISDSQVCERQLDKPVNKIGSTARDFQRGDCLAGLRRYEIEGKQGMNESSDLMLKMHGGSVMGR